MMKEIPILYSTPMVQSILAGRKTNTRRLNRLHEVNKDPDSWEYLYLPVKNVNGEIAFVFVHKGTEENLFIKCPYGQPGDILWVRESWLRTLPPSQKIYYKAGPEELIARSVHEPWKPSIHMPKSACRIWLQVEGVRVERLQDISEEDARAEGVPEYYLTTGTSDGSYWGYGFNCLWNEINGIESWDANPWVWVISFKVLSTTGRPL